MSRLSKCMSAVACMLLTLRIHDEDERGRNVDITSVYITRNDVNMYVGPNLVKHTGPN